VPRTPSTDFLQPDEEVLLEARRHPLSIVDDLVVALGTWLVLVGATAYALLAFWPEGWLLVGVPVAITATAGVVLFSLARWWRVRTSVYVVTGERVYKAYGRLRFFLGQTTYDKVTDLHMKQSLFGRRWGFGTVRLETAGAGLPLEGLRDPAAFKRRIEAARAGFVHALAAELAPRRLARLGQEGGTGQAEGEDAAAGTADLVDEEDIWSGSPSGPFFAGHSVGGILLATLGVLLLAGTLLVGPGTLLPGALLTLLGAARILGAWVQYRYTRYHLRPGGVVVTSGWLTRRRSETTFEKVTDVATYQSVVGRLLDYGSITINTAGSNTAPVVFQGLADPESVKARIDEARRRWRQR